MSNAFTTPEPIKEKESTDKICLDPDFLAESVYKTTQNHISAVKYRYWVDDRSTQVVPASIRNILVRVNGVRIDELTPNIRFQPDTYIHTYIHTHTSTYMHT